MLQYKKDQTLNPFDQELLQNQLAPWNQNRDTHLIRSECFSTKDLFGLPENNEQLQESDVNQQISRISFRQIKESQQSLYQTLSKSKPCILDVNSNIEIICQKQLCSAEQDRIQNQFGHTNLVKDNCTSRRQTQPQATQSDYQDQDHRKATSVNLKENQSYHTMVNAQCVQSSLKSEQTPGLCMERDNLPLLTASSNFQISKQDDLFCYESEIIDPSLINY
ncbi:hypothetical protein FGO68_gene5380 [Halteria grandinella]|uniref:Uncharacterized protein n=1 Tax=Halteria grandinella TaxID=5974 RepID=A0A8J8P2A8_HALGN|nr:hypothetical protein FGO68_gene5380 [Halteria grandinella]